MHVWGMGNELGKKHMWIVALIKVRKCLLARKKKQYNSFIAKSSLVFDLGLIA